MTAEWVGKLQHTCTAYAVRRNRESGWCDMIDVMNSGAAVSGQCHPTRSRKLHIGAGGKLGRTSPKVV